MSQMATGLTQEYRAALRQNLTDFLSDTDLRNLCFDMGVDYQCLPGEGKSDKARELISYLERCGRIPELVKNCSQLRPNVNWGQREKTRKQNPLPGLKNRFVILGVVGGIMSLIVVLAIYGLGRAVALTKTPAPTATPTAISTPAAPIAAPASKGPCPGRLNIPMTRTETIEVHNGDIAYFMGWGFDEEIGGFFVTVNGPYKGTHTLLTGVYCPPVLAGEDQAQTTIEMLKLECEKSRGGCSHELECNNSLGGCR